jgi:hypothetical protein
MATSLNLASMPSRRSREALRALVTTCTTCAPEICCAVSFMPASPPSFLLASRNSSFLLCLSHSCLASSRAAHQDPFHTGSRALKPQRRPYGLKRSNSMTRSGHALTTCFILMSNIQALRLCAAIHHWLFQALMRCLQHLWSVAKVCMSAAHYERRDGTCCHFS